uniref:Uncharacterized protein n=1 Tax=Trichogramma kaykai TaxID=54128 RepID=A0ABD2WP67_9HYME
MPDDIQTLYMYQYFSQKIHAQNSVNTSVQNQKALLLRKLPRLYAVCLGYKGLLMYSGASRARHLCRRVKLLRSTRR